MKDLLVCCSHVGLFLPGSADHRLILKDITFDLHSGEHGCVVGPNGSGKSTLLRLLAGEIWAAEGEISWLGTDGKREKSLLAGRAICAHVSPAVQTRYQKNRWHISGYELVLTGLEGTPMLYGQSDDEQAEEIYQLCGQLDCVDLLERDISTLSQGQLRILLLARALIRKPKLLLLDECTEGLDKAHRIRFFEILESQIDITTMFFATHRVRYLPTFCKRHFYAENGLVVETPSLGRNVSHRMQISCSVPVIGHPIFTLENATVFVDGHEILHQINWEVSVGENWLVHGGNGSGKSTLLRLLNGDEVPAFGGRILRWMPSAGENGDYVPVLEDLRRKIGFVSPHLESAYNYPVSAWDLVLTGYDNSIGVYREYSDEEKQGALFLLAKFFPEEDLEHLLTRPRSMLSTGELRKLFLARALVTRPDVLLMDEPCSSLDFVSRERYLHILEQVVQGIIFNKPVTLIYVSHNESDIPNCINRRAVIENGFLRVEKLT